MTTQIERLISIAERDLGYKESPPNSNRTKFGRWYGLDGNPWCMMAVQYWFNEAGFSGLLTRTASCTALLNWAQRIGRFYTSNYKRGDVVLFNWKGAKTPAEHVGIVTGTTSAGVHTIEGNTAVGNDSNGGEVMHRVRKYNTIIGVLRPEYEGAIEQMTQDDFNRMMAVYIEDQTKLDESVWSDKEGYFKQMTEMGFMDGSSPQRYLTREQFAAVIGRMGLLNGDI